MRAPKCKLCGQCLGVNEAHVSSEQPLQTNVSRETLPKRYDWAARERDHGRTWAKTCTSKSPEGVLCGRVFGMWPRVLMGITDAN